MDQRSFCRTNRRTDGRTMGLREIDKKYWHILSKLFSCFKSTTYDEFISFKNCVSEKQNIKIISKSSKNQDKASFSVCWRSSIYFSKQNEKKYIILRTVLSFSCISSACLRQFCDILLDQ